MSITDKRDVSWFRDAEQNEPSSARDISTTEPGRRPWRAYWPPKSEYDLGIWLHCEFPQVLSWRFDPDKPFDRPWRYWARTVLAKKEEEIIQQDLRSHLENQASTSDTNFEDQVARLPKIKVESFLYLAPLQLYHTQKPYRSRLPHGSSMRRTNIVERGYPVEVRDIRGHENLFALDKSGFEFIPLPTKTSNWTDDNVRSEYLPDLSKWMKDYFSCEKVFIYAYNLRSNDMKQAGRGPWKPPIFRAHCDVTGKGCVKRLGLQFPNEAEKIMKGRYRFVTVWRSINGQETDSPLAFCDYRTVAKDDLMEADMVYPHISDEGYEVLYNPAHRWFYKKGMSTSEVVVFKLDDSLTTAAKFAPHAAFMDPSASGDFKRASIEARAIIIG